MLPSSLLAVAVYKSIIESPPRHPILSRERCARLRCAPSWAVTALDLCNALYYRLVMDEGVLNVTFGALADPTRRAILAKLAKGDASVLELAAPFDMSQPAISKHLKVL